MAYKQSQCIATYFSMQEPWQLKFKHAMPERDTTDILTTGRNCDLPMAVQVHQGYFLLRYEYYRYENTMSVYNKYNVVLFKGACGTLN